MSTTTTSKKKLIYRQDADGVFRLKKVSSGATSSASSISDQPQDELCDLSYKFVPSAESHKQPEPFPAIEEEPSCPKIPLLPSGASTDSDSIKSTSKKSKKQEKDPRPNLSQLNKIVNKHNIHQEIHPDPPVKLAPAAEIEPVSTSVSNLSKLQSFFTMPKATPPPTSMADQRVLSFIAGLVTAVILQKLSPTISYYAVVLLGLLKVVVIGGIVVGAIAWYAGLIDVSQANEMLDLLKSKMNTIHTQKAFPGSPQRSPLSDSGSDVDSDISWPGMDSDEEKKPGSPLEIPMIPNPKPPAERKNTLSTIAPFVAPKRTQPRLSRMQTEGIIKKDGPSLEYDRRDSAATIDMARGARHRDVRSMSPVSRQISPHKKLPPFPGNEDLPLVNEIKLLRKHDEDDLYHEPKRLTSVMSKQSVLGTRANYDKFLANAGSS